jgi:hypothetical protein
MKSRPIAKVGFQPLGKFWEGLDVADDLPKAILRASYPPDFANFEQKRRKSSSATFAIGLVEFRLVWCDKKTRCEKKQ